MFFRRETTKTLSFADQVSHLRSTGFQTEPAAQGGTLVTRRGLGALLAEDPTGKPKIVDSGIVLGKELALLTDVGYQKVFRTESGKVVAAQADYLHALHSFVEDLREALGLTSLYNESLGTTNERHLYDRVAERDLSRKPKPWEKASN